MINCGHLYACLHYSFSFPFPFPFFPPFPLLSSPLPPSPLLPSPLLFHSFVHLFVNSRALFLNKLLYSISVYKVAVKLESFSLTEVEKPSSFLDSPSYVVCLRPKDFLKALRSTWCFPNYVSTLIL